MEIVYALLFVLIGFSLGLIGGGGSILAVPVLVYVLHFEAQVATGYSLFIIGITSFIGAFAFLKKRDFSLEAILQFLRQQQATVEEHQEALDLIYR